MAYLSRSDWGAVPPVRTVPVSKRLKGVCLHYMGFPVRTEDPVRLATPTDRGVDDDDDDDAGSQTLSITTDFSPLRRVLEMGSESSSASCDEGGAQ